MTLDLEEKIGRRFDFLELGTGAPSDEFMFSIECGDGWYNLLLSMLVEIEKQLDKERADKFYNLKKELRDEPAFKIIRIKEKWGALDVTAHNPSEEIYNIIYRYERQSKDICEFCGNPASTNMVGSQLKTVCEICYPKIKK